MTTTMAAPDGTVALSLSLLVVRLLSPAFVFISTLSLLFARPSPPSPPSVITSVVVATRVPRLGFILSLLSLTASTYLLDGLTFVVYAVFQKSWPADTGIEINSALGLAAFAGLAALGAWKHVHGVEIWAFKRIRATLAASLVLDFSQVVLIGILTYRLHSPTGTPFTFPAVLHLVFPICRVLILLPLLAGLVSPRVAYISVMSDQAPQAPEPSPSSYLLPPGSQIHSSTGLSPVSGLVGDVSKYGTFRAPPPTPPGSNPITRATTPSPSNVHDQKPEKPEISLEPSWSEIGRRLRRIIPYLWPAKDRYLQFLAMLCILILIVGRFVNATVPFVFGGIVHIFEEGSTRSPWPYIFTYVGLRFLQGAGGLPALRDTLWAPVMQYSDREMSQLSFDHLLNLSLNFHMHRQTGEVLRILDRGAAINNTLEIILFNIVPTFIDISVALVIFCVKFGWILSLVIFIVMVLYVMSSVMLTTWRTRIRRQMNDRDTATRSIHTDCLLNYETVKYFGGEQHEGNRYREAIREYQALEYKVVASLNLLNLVQNLIISLGLLIGSVIVGLSVTRGNLYPSDFVIFIAYLAQLYGPLNSVGYIYRTVNKSLVDTEKLLKLLNEPTEVTDKPNAPALVVNNGDVEFQNVSFSYDGRTKALNGVSFKVPKGSSVALVGESGAGKSTVLRLLYRFYDLPEGGGKILIDDQDITEVTQESLRKAIGVVPQDPVLFNSTISYNIGYGKFGASPDEIEAAAGAAQMHERIMGFPDGYDTKVGERGVRLSGGEKQRVAIARTLLKNPPILLLDEATSALDTSTEKDIQKALQYLVKGRSSLSIAHRLSTIASADIILVLKDGQIVEQGSHKELLALNGIFASMWTEQISASDDPALSVGENSGKEISGYSVEKTESVPTPTVDDMPQERTTEDTAIKPISVDEVAEIPTVDWTDAATSPVAFPLTDTQNQASATQDVAAGSVQPSEIAQVSPVSSAGPAEKAPTPTPGVTFGSEVNTPPRINTPDPEAEPKRKRISSQNFQRLARKISLTTRRTGSTSSIPIIPGLKRSDSPRGSTDGSVRGEGEAKSESPTPSLPGEPDKGKKKDKKKKEQKRRSLF